MQRAHLLYIHAREDEECLLALERHLSSLKRNGLIESWYNGHLLPGQNIKLEIARQFEKSEIIILLLSADLLASPQWDDLLPSVLRVKADHKKFLVPVLIRPVYWKTEALNGLSPLPLNGKSISEWDNQDAAWLEIVEAIERLVKSQNQHIAQPTAGVLTREGNRISHAAWFLAATTIAGMVALLVLVFGMVPRWEGPDIYKLVVGIAATSSATVFLGALTFSLFRHNRLYLMWALLFSFLAALSTSFSILIYLQTDKTISVIFREVNSGTTCPGGLVGLQPAINTWHVSGNKALPSTPISSNCTSNIRVARSRMALQKFYVDLEPNDYYVVSNETAEHKINAGTIFVKITHINNSHRVKIQIFPYAGADEKQFGTYKTTLDEKMLRLVEELNYINSEHQKDLAYLSGLEIKLATGEHPTEHRARERYWWRTNSLGLLSGILTPSSPPEVVSSFYLGHLAPNLHSASLSLRLKISPEEFGATRDSHSAAVLYALAIDAHRMKEPPYVVAMYLNKAWEIIEDLEKVQKSDTLKQEVLAAIENFHAENGK